MPPTAAARNAFVRLLVSLVWGVRERVLERPTIRAVLRTLGRPAIWLMHQTAGAAPPAPPQEPDTEIVLHLPLDYRFGPLNPPPRIAMLLHAYYPELVPEILQRLRNIPVPVDVFVSTDAEDKRPPIAEALADWSAGRVEIRVMPNRGRNVAPQLIGFADVIAGYDLVLLLHTKKSLHWDALEGWREAILRDLLPPGQGVEGLLEAFRRLPSLGMAAPSIFPPTRRHMVWAPNFSTCRRLGDRMGLALAPDSPLDFPAGSMFWARPAALKPLLDLHLAFEDFEPEGGQKDATLAHAIERLFFFSCEQAGLRWIRVRAGADAVWPERFLRADSPQALRRCVTDLGRTLVLPGRPPDPTRTEDVGAPETPEARKAAFRLACRDELDAFLAGGERLALPTTQAPEVSIVLVLFNQAELTFQCLRSLRLAMDRPCEVIIVDNASSDRTGELLDRLDGARVVRNGENLHFLRAVNQAAALANGQALLLLNNDARVRPGSIAAAWSRLSEEPDVGAVAARILLLDRTLQEAGSIIWRDGACLGVGRGADPERGEFQFRRDVDYGSGAFLMIRRAAFEALGGLSESFAPAYYEETDFCMRLRGAGFRVAYEPRAVIWHFEFGSAASTEAALDLQRRHHQVFVDTHRAALSAAHLPHGAPLLEARMRDGPGRRLLIVEDQVPYARLGAGYPRAVDLIHAAHTAGWFVTLFPAVYADVDFTTAYDSIPPEVEIASEWGGDGLARFLHERRGYYHAVVVSRPHNMRRFAEALRTVPEFIGWRHVVYDAEAIFAARDVTGPKAAEAIRQETALARRARAVLAVSAAEAKAFRKAGVRDVRVLAHAAQPRPTPAPFEDRRDLLFVGALDDDNSPNADSLVYFVEAVTPLLDGLIGADWKLHVAGRNGASQVQALASERVRLLGSVPDLGDLYGRSRVFIAPTRQAAGIPMKLHEAAARGLPAVATPLLAGQLGWSDGVELLTADGPAAFAEACARLYTDPELWARVRENALEAVERDCAPERFRQTLAEALDAAARP